MEGEAFKSFDQRLVLEGEMCLCIRFHSHCLFHQYVCSFPIATKKAYPLAIATLVWTQNEDDLGLQLKVYQRTTAQPQQNGTQTENKSLL